MSNLLHLSAIALFAVPAMTPAQEPEPRQLAQGWEREADVLTRPGVALARPARLIVRDVLLADALVELSLSSGIPVAFSSSMLPQGKLVSCDCEQVSVAEAFQVLLAGTGLVYAEVREQIVIERAAPAPAGRNGAPGEPGRRFAFASSGLPSPGTSPVRTIPRTPYRSQTGTVTGTVTTRPTAEPLNGAQVSVEGAGIGTLTDTRGRFLLAEVPAGTQTISVSHIGYSPVTREVTIETGGTEVVNFELSTRAISLDAIVVTGTGGEVERRKVGSSLVTLDVSDVMDVVPVQDVGTALEGRIPGVRSLATAGGVGSARHLYVRGVSSLSLGQRPVVYIDGVRVDTRSADWSDLEGVTPRFAGSTGEDRLSDLNPADIERIEVLKGASATTLYGSEATNGVIQIFTKQGRSDTPAEWSLSVSSGFNRLRPNVPTKLYPNFTGPDGFRALDANEHLIETGMIRTSDLSVRGGGQNVTYFASAAYSDEEGSIQPNYMRRGNFRLNVGFVPAAKWAVDLRSGYSRNDMAVLQQSSNWYMILGQALRGDPRQATPERPYGENWIPIGDVKAIETMALTNRFTGSVKTSYTPTERMAHRLTLGLDYLNEEKTRLMPFGREYQYVGDTGERNAGQRNFASATLDYLGTLRLDLPGDIGSELGWGAQGFREVERVVMGTGRFFAGTGVTTIRGGSITIADEDFRETVNIGLFAQNRFSFRDALFVTAGLRVDGNSAFGVNYGLKAYPKADVSYVVSEAMRLPAIIGSLRVRGALGWSGLAPGAYDQFQTFDPVPAMDDEPAVAASNPGNPELRPETTRELDLGVEMGLFRDRVGIELSGYHALTYDALLPVPLPHSAGFPEAQFRNVGEILNVGWEFAINAIVMDRSSVQWHTRLNVDGNRNEILDLGEAAVDGRLGNHRVGYPVAAVFDRGVESYDPVTRTHTRSQVEEYVGRPLPANSASWTNTLSFGRVTLYGAVSAERGAILNNGERRVSNQFRTGDEYLATLDENGAPTAASDSLRNFADIFNYLEPRDNIRIRELSLTYRIPDGLTNRLGLRRTSFQLSGQNLHWWDKCDFCMDPNGQQRAGLDFGWTSNYGAVPSPRRFVATIRTNF